MQDGKIEKSKAPLLSPQEHTYDAYRGHASSSAVEKSDDDGGSSHTDDAEKANLSSNREVKQVHEVTDSRVSAVLSSSDATPRVPLRSLMDRSVRRVPNLDLYKRKDIQEKYDFSEEYMTQLKQGMVKELDSGYITRRFERDVTFMIMDQFMQCPPLRNKYMKMLHDDLPNDDPAMKLRIQTARAFGCAKQYLYDTHKPDVDRSSYMSEYRIYRDYAIDAIADQLEDTRNPDLIIFSGMKDRDHHRDKTVKIEDCVVLSRSDWAKFPGVSKQVGQLLGPANWHKQSPDVWNMSGEQLPRIRERLDLSSLGLSYEGEAVRSLDIIYYEVEEEKSGESSSEEDSKKRKAISYSTSKLVMESEDEYYTLPLMAGKEVGSRISGKVKPFLSGIQHERDCSQGKREQYRDEYWQTLDVWRCAPRVSERYYGKLYPAVSHHAVKVAEQRIEKQGKTELTILDLAGGNGDPAEFVIKSVHARFPDKPLKYILVDYTEGSVNIANERFRALNLSNVTARAFQRNMFSYEFSAERMKADKEIGLPQQGVDIVINCGGMLNNNIIGDNNTGVKFSRMFIGLMDIHAFGVYTGFTDQMVGKEHHEENGARVLNCYDWYADCQMYDVQRLPSEN